MNEEKIGLFFTTIYLILSGVIFYFVWFKDGANKLNRLAIKVLNYSVNKKPSTFYKVENNPSMYKSGSLLVFLFGIYAFLKTIHDLL